MTERLFKATIIAAAAVFAALFVYWCIPPMVENPDLIGAFAAGFVNPYSSGYAADTLACWAILTAWIAYEARTRGVRHGWIFALLGIIPGVAVGFAGYLLLRAGQLGHQAKGMAQMSKVYDETGRELYMGAGDREHD